MKTPETTKTDEQQVRDLIEGWAKAVREKNYDAILANHSTNFLMFDVPPPFESRGIEAYRKTWDLFFSCQRQPIAFDIQWMEVVAGTEVAFVIASMNCEEKLENEKWAKLNFRLTIGLRKIEGEWTILHEHHSVPAV